MTRRMLALFAPACAIALTACGGSSTAATTTTQTVTAPGPTVTATQTVTVTASPSLQSATSQPATFSSAEDNTGTVNQVIDQFHCDTVYPSIDYTLQVSDAQRFWDCKWLESNPTGEVMVADFGSEAPAIERYHLLTQKGLYAMRRGSVIVLGQTKADIATAKARWK